MVATLPTETRSSQVRAPERDEPASQGETAGWTGADLERLADKVYELLMQDLMLEIERGAW